ncbi:M15 family metallopeptidase [Gemelliphila palaticanis]|uniref:M15 family metallopeptidase n=1 Tax=Gemelliphila palaticanis TaxID=81950 RepID=A0ABX2SZT0_9BACL|nr:M15 family metallopeptidase [Gemella palaticanis]MBF0715875.1 M15 family metallopeptidase [Gemella palaticanis]NYS47805.1 M15 family metallopeptidase [Gemella palaticanis]
MKKLIYLLFGFILFISIYFIVNFFFFSEEKTAVNKENNKSVINSSQIKKSNNNEEHNSSKDNRVEKSENKVSNKENNLNNQIITPETVTEPTYVNGIMIINKKNPLPRTYNRGEDPEARRAVNKLIADMQSKGMNVSNQTSGFRSYEYQGTLYNNYVSSHGKQQADTFSARPGYSEHQSGLAFDLIDNQGQLLGAPGTIKSSIDAASWLEHNAHNYGFVVRYKKEYVNYTGYNEESWHLRYLGNDLATKLYNENISLEQYLGVQGGEYLD